MVTDTQLPSVLQCENVKCCNTEHICEIDTLCDKIIQCCLEAGVVFPKCKKRRKFPYWSEKVKPVKEEAMFWQKIWIDRGKPDHGIIYDLKRETKLKYHYAVRQLKRNSDVFRKKRMAEALDTKNSRNFWTEVKKINGKKVNCPTHIENRTNNEDIASLFAEKYMKLYNSVPSDIQVLNNISGKVSKDINHNSAEKMKITDNHIIKAMKNIKKNKADSDGKLFSNHILYAPIEVYKLFCFLFNAMLVHGYTPKSLLNSNIISIPKDIRGDLSSDDNYRGISLCSSLLKLFELVLIQKQGSNLFTSDMQFAYKDGHSTTMSTLVLKDVVNHFLTKGSNVYACFIDASKAFDRLRHDMLFDILYKRNVDPLMIRILMDMYARQTIQTSWLGTKSDKFTCQNGVRQGGILSPLLYSVYNDVLLTKLKEAGYGCWIANHFYGALSYADDLCVLSPTVSGLQHMLNLCEEYGAKYEVLFNPKKTHCMRFSRDIYSCKFPQLKLCGQQLNWVENVKYLGNWLSVDLKEETEISKKLSSFFGSVNNMSSSFRNVGYKHVSVLFNSYCCHMYGSQAWRLYDKSVDRIYIAWNKAIRHLCKLPYRTHTKFLPYIVGTLPIKEQIYLRTEKMITTMLNSSNVSVKFLATNNLKLHTSIIGENMHIIESYINKDDVNENAKTILLKKQNEMFTADIHCIIELLEIVEGDKVVPGFTVHEIEDLLDNICTM
jgi:hypothetical protein